MRYRAQQFFQAIIPAKIRLEELEWVYKMLPPPALPLFFAQSLPDQRHALDVALDLNSIPTYLPSRNLLVAALLHDCGKSRNPLKIWERIYIVFAQQAPRKVWNVLLHSPPFFSSPLLTAENHPTWGAEFARNAGLDPKIVKLIQFHHCPKSPEGRLLYEADNRH